MPLVPCRDGDDPLAPGAWPEDATRVLEVLSRTLQPGVVQGVYLYGSCVASRLRHQSDLDLLVLMAEPIVGPPGRPWWPSC